jgi:hypothetical protein
LAKLLEFVCAISLGVCFVLRQDEFLLEAVDNFCRLAEGCAEKVLLLELV